MPVAQIEKAKAILLIGSNPRHEHAAARASHPQGVEEAARKCFAVNPLDFEFNFDLAARPLRCRRAECSTRSLRLAQGRDDAGHLPESGALAQAIRGVSADDRSAQLFKGLSDGDVECRRDPRRICDAACAGFVAAAARTIRRRSATNCAYNEIPSGANAVGLARVGACRARTGKHAAAMLAQPPRQLIDYHSVRRTRRSAAAYDEARSKVGFGVYIGAYACAGVKRTAHAVLPIGLPPEDRRQPTSMSTVACRRWPPARNCRAMRARAGRYCVRSVRRSA